MSNWDRKLRSAFVASKEIFRRSDGAGKFIAAASDFLLGAAKGGAAAQSPSPTL
jgi:hypothetical protein